MIELSLADIDKLRKSGLRPEVIGVIYKDGKILMCYDNEHEIWMFPQGGVDNNENLKDALAREMEEELGAEFVSTLKNNIQFVLDDIAEFPKDKFGSRPLFTDSGDEIVMKGKKYFIFAIEASSNNINATKTEFEECVFLDYEGATKIANEIYQPSKKRIALRIIEKMKEMGLLV